jgi:hypothetical protein
MFEKSPPSAGFFFAGPVQTGVPVAHGDERLSNVESARVTGTGSNAFQPGELIPGFVFLLLTVQ